MLASLRILTALYAAHMEASLELFDRDLHSPLLAYWLSLS
jgi:hypothetical protein